MADIVDSNGFTLFDHDLVTGRCVWVKHEGDKDIYRIDMPIGAILDANHEAEMATHGQRFGDWNRVASIPHHLAYANGVNQAIEQRDDKWLSQFLNSSDHAKLRTSRGRV